MNKPLYELSVDPSIDKGNIPQQHLLYTNKEKENSKYDSECHKKYPTSEEDVSRDNETRRILQMTD